MKLNHKTNRWALLQKLTRPLVLAFIAVAMSAVGITVGNAHADIETWGPQDRATFTWNAPATYVTFNSMTDNPQIGDERNFVRVRKADTHDTYVDEVTIEPGAEYEVFVWFHNNASSNLNSIQDGIGIADNVRLLLSIPEIVPAGHAAAIKATISADNANPNEVWDLAFAKTEQGVALRFVPNSAVLHYNEPGTYDSAKGGWYDSKGRETAEGKILNEDALFGRDGYGGAKLTYWEQNWGYLPACSEYSGYVLFRLKADQPNLEMSKTVSKEGEDNFGETITAEPGDVLEFKIEYKNTGTTIQQPVSMTDKLPAGLTYIEGSTYFWSSRHNAGNYVGDDLFNGNLNLGGFEPGDSAYVTYKVRVDDDVNLFPCGDTTITNEGIVGTDDGSGHDRTEITVHRVCDCVTNPELPECQQLPTTGPVEVAIATLIIGGIGGAGYYLYRTRRTLKTVESGAINGHNSGHHASSLHRKSQVPQTPESAHPVHQQPTAHPTPEHHAEEHHVEPQNPESHHPETPKQD